MGARALMERGAEGMKRTTDRERAGIRRVRQHGESEDQYIARIREQLAKETELGVAIERRHHPTDYLIRGYLPGQPDTPAIRIHRVSLLSAIDAFKFAADKLRGAGLARQAGVS